MKNNDNYTEIVIKNSYKEIIYKIITSIFTQGLLLIIPLFWSRVISHLSELNFHNSYYLITISIFIVIFYYIWKYLDQVSWFKLYNKLYIGYTSLISKSNNLNVKKISLGEYTNVINNDIDIISNFIVNSILRIIQIIEFIVIYIFFLSLNIYIFLITVVISIVLVIIILISGKQVKNENIKRKGNLDKKTIVLNEVFDHLKIGNINNNILKKFNTTTLEYLKANESFNLLSYAFIYTILATLEICKYAIIIYGIYLIKIGNIEVGTILLIYTYYDKIIANFEVIGTVSAEYQSFIVSLKRLNRLGTELKKTINE